MPSIRVHSLIIVLVTLSPFLRLAGAHSWVELMHVIHSNGSYTGEAGYPRGFVSRVTGFNDTEMTYLIESNGDDPYLCHPNQRGGQSSGFPRLTASPGSMVALSYQENGHVTFPQNQKGKPANRGTVFLYATNQPKADEKYLDVYSQWTVDGRGGDGRGKLLAALNFDDGQCHNNDNHSDISVQRQEEFRFTPSNPYGANLWCQNNLVIPQETEVGKPLTLYWVWSWPTSPNQDPALPNGKNETYSTCMDIDIEAPSTSSTNLEVSKNFKYIPGQDVQEAGISTYIPQLAGGKNIFVQTHATFVVPPGNAAATGASVPVSAPPATSGSPSIPTSSAVAIASSSVPQPSHVAGPIVDPVPTGSVTVNAPTSVSTPTTVVVPAISVETVFVYPSSTGLAAPTGSGFSLSTAVASGPIMSEPAASGSSPAVPVIPATSTAVAGPVNPVATTAGGAIGAATLTTAAVPNLSTASSSTAAPMASSGALGTGTPTSNPMPSNACKPNGVQKRSIVFNGEEAKRSKVFVEETVEEAIENSRLRRSAKFRS